MYVYISVCVYISIYLYIYIYIYARTCERKVTYDQTQLSNDKHAARHRHTCDEQHQPTTTGLYIYIYVYVYIYIYIYINHFDTSGLHATAMDPMTSTLVTLPLARDGSPEHLESSERVRRMFRRRGAVQEQYSYSRYSSYSSYNSYDSYSSYDNYDVYDSYTSYNSYNSYKKLQQLQAAAGQGLRERLRSA